MSIVLYVLLGVAAGLMAGLLGVGGGLIIVPALIAIFTLQGFAADTLVQMAVGTSLACIVFTSISSVHTHHQNKAVLWQLLAWLAPALALGSLSGAWLAEWMGGPALQALFGVFAITIAARMLLSKEAADPEAAYTPPSRLSLSIAGILFGAISGLFGIGGGSMVVPYLVHYRLAMQKAVGTSSAAGLPIAVAGALGFMLVGADNANLPAGSVGYVYLPALAAIVVMSFPFARVGATLAHRLPAQKLKKIFALLLVVVGIDLMWSGGSQLF